MIYDTFCKYVNIQNQVIKPCTVSSARSQQALLPQNVDVAQSSNRLLRSEGEIEKLVKIK